MKEVTISTSRRNTRGGRVLTSGIDTEQYQRNPILLWMHNRPWRGTKDEILPIGTVENLRFEGDSLIGTPVFDESDDFAKQIKAKWESGVLRMVSPGLDVLDTSSDSAVLLPGQTRETVTKCILREVSIVDMGANDDALVLAYKGRMLNLAAGENDSDFIPLINNSETRDMKAIALKLGLVESADEAAILGAIGTLMQNAAATDGLRTELDTLKLSNITGMVDAAIAEKRIPAEKKEHFIALGKTAGAGVLKETFAAIAPAVSISNMLGGKGGAQGAAEYKKLSDVPEAELLRLRSEDQPTYERLFMAEYGFKPVY